MTGHAEIAPLCAGSRGYAEARRDERDPPMTARLATNELSPASEA